MQLFSTILDINAAMDREAFIDLVMEWNITNPYMENVIADMKWKGEKDIRFGDDKLWLHIKDYPYRKITAVRYEKQEGDGTVWDTDYIMNYAQMKLSVIMDRSFVEEVPETDKDFSTPRFITLLIEHGYLKDDYRLPIRQTPYVIGEKSLSEIADVINGKSRYKLPVVYVSKTYENKDPVNTTKLSWMLKGIAHVLLEEDKELGKSLREMCGDRNEYLGAVGVYNTALEDGHKRFMYRKAAGEDDALLEKIARYVLQRSSTRMTDPMYTWYGVNNSMMLDELKAQRARRLDAENARREAETQSNRLMDHLDDEKKKLRDDALAEANALIEGFDEDMARMQSQIEELTHTVDLLQIENQMLKARLDAKGSEPVLYMGDEYEFYPGEIKDMILKKPHSHLSHILKFDNLL